MKWIVSAVVGEVVGDDWVVLEGGGATALTAKRLHRPPSSRTADFPEHGLLAKKRHLQYVAAVAARAPTASHRAKRLFSDVSVATTQI